MIKQLNWKKNKGKLQQSICSAIRKDRHDTMANS